MHPFINKASQAAREASRVISQGIDRLDRLTFTEKSQNELVSNVDRSAEAIIIETLGTAYPDHTIIGKESGVAVKGGGDFTWLINPLDGTINFLYGIPHFSISIACRSPDQIEHALILDPLRHEEFSASRNQGAQLNQRRIQVSKRQRLSTTVVAGGLPFPGQSGDTSLLRSVAPEISSLCRGVRSSGSLALDMAYVATGRLDATWGAGLKPWDAAAGALLIQEANGLAADFSGEQKYLETGEILAGTTKCFRALLRIIQQYRDAHG